MFKTHSKGTFGWMISSNPGLSVSLRRRSAQAVAPVPAASWVTGMHLTWVALDTICVTVVRTVDVLVTVAIGKMEVKNRFGLFALAS